jgi:hypothetical protein
MSDLAHLHVFLVAALILLVTPGPAVLYIVARSLDQGRGAGLVSVLSIEVGNLVHVMAATLGLSAILLSSAMAFSIIKYLGAAYLIYLGVRRLTAQEPPESTMTIDFDNAAPAAFLREPGNDAAWGARVKVSGVVLDGYAVTVDGTVVPLDIHQRFTAEVPAPVDHDAIAVKFVHPARGVHYYLRRRGGGGR